MIVRYEKENKYNTKRQRERVREKCVPILLLYINRNKMFLNINKIVLGIFDYYSDKKQTEIRKKKHERKDCEA